MDTRGALGLLLAALLAAPAALRAGEFVSTPSILTVHGLNPAAIACDPGSVQNFAHNEACYAAAALFSKMGDPERFDDSYLDESVKGLCRGDCGRVTAFRWGGDIKTSRAAVERLKEEILRLGRQAREQGAPFIIIAHSWGTVLTAEALAEMDGDATAGDLRVDKLVTLGSPLGAAAYSLAVNGLISGQNFYQKPRRAAQVARWDNYYAPRDLISSRVALADSNTAIDSDPKYDDAERRLEELLLLQAGTPGGQELTAGTARDLQHFTLAGATELWHAAYFTRHRLQLDSLSETLDIDAVSRYSPGYFSWQ